MKHLITLLTVLFSATVFGQNVGIGETNPIETRLQIKRPDSALLLLQNSTTGADVKTGLFFKNGNAYSGSIITTGSTFGQAFRMGFSTFGAPTPAGLLERLSITDAGNIGIGITNPSAKLEVNGQIKITGGTPGAGELLESDANGLASWVDKSSSFLPTGLAGNTIRHNGINWLSSNNLYNNGTYIGIGNTNPTLGGLVVDTKVGSINAMFGSNTSGVAIESANPGIAFNSYFSGSRKSINTGFGGLIGQDPGTGRMYMLSSPNAVTGQGTTLPLSERLSITSNGNIGIQGNTAPASPLSFSNAGGDKINLYQESAGQIYGMGINSGTLQIYTPNTGARYIAFGAGNSSSFTQSALISNTGALTIEGADAGYVFRDRTDNSYFGWNWYANAGKASLYRYGFGDAMTVNANGSVCIGTAAPATGYLFNVNGKIISEEVRVQLKAAWPDYVFEKNYKKLSLNELEKYVDEHKHLPNIPSAKEIEKDGQHLGEIQRKMLEKIEELSLYVIELKKEIDLLKTPKN